MPLSRAYDATMLHARSRERESRRGATHLSQNMKIRTLMAVTKERRKLHGRKTQACQLDHQFSLERWQQQIRQLFTNALTPCTLRDRSVTYMFKFRPTESAVLVVSVLRREVISPLLDVSKNAISCLSCGES